MSRLLVIGTGLVGGSFALAMRGARRFDHIDGHDADAAAAAAALQLGHIDAVAHDLDAAIATADAVLVAVPTPAIAPLVRRIAAARPTDTPTVLDVGSVKGSVLEALRGSGAMPPCFVPSHPMAGSERRGPAAADATLFRGRPVDSDAATGNRSASARSRARLVECHRRAGRRNERADSRRNGRVDEPSSAPDRVRVHELGRRPHAAAPADFAGPGLHDFTRIAASDASMWRRILSENRTAVLAQYDGWSASMTRFIELLRSRRFDELEALLADAQAARQRMTDRGADHE